MGPAGTGKTTFCKTMIEHLSATKKKANLVNLDPAAEKFDSSLTPSVDIRDKWSLGHVMQKKMLGPNGGLIKCLELMVDEGTWLEDALRGFGEEFLFVDCPGQVEVYLHSRAMQSVVETFKENDYNICVAFLIDSQFLLDKSKYLAGILNTTSAMLQLELPHVNIVTKMDILLHDPDADFEEIQKRLFPDLQEMFSGSSNELDIAFLELIDTFNLVQYSPLDITDNESVGEIMVLLNNVLQNDDIDVSGPDAL